MPLYDVEHSHSLTEEQKHQLAEAITTIHSEKFEAPRFFVNVNIKDISSVQTYVAGKQVGSNPGIHFLRPTYSPYTQHTQDV